MSVANLPVNNKFECQHCGKRFVLEAAFMKHYCPEMEKLDIMKTIDGQASYVHYTNWLKKQGRKAPSSDRYITSSYFRSFVKFAEFVRDVAIPDPDRYIDIMVEKQIAPLLWTRNECYSMYLNWIDLKSPAMEQVDISVNTILDLAEAGGITPNQLFDVIHMRDIIQLLHQRKISPWFLLCSKKFKEMLTKASTEDNQELLKLINIEHWANKLAQSDDVVKQIKLITTEMGV